MKFRLKGFTLFELMIVVAILSFVVVMAYPSYVESVRKARRADAQAQMREFEVLAARQYTLANNYACFAEGGGCGASVTDDYYTITIAPTNGNLAWTVTATPSGDQANDDCGTMTLNSLGQMTGAKAGCWGGRGTS